MLFSELSKYFERIEKNSSRLEITRILAELFKTLNDKEIGKVVYLLQGKVGPAYEGIDFGMAERTIIKASMSALNVDRVYFEKEFKKSGDLGTTVENFKKLYFSFEEKNMEVLEVFDFFYRIATASGIGSQEVKISLLSQLIRQLDSLSGRYLVRLPTGIIRLGFSDMTILDAYSWMLKEDKSLRPIIETAYHVRPDLGFIGKTLKEKGLNGLKKVEPRVFTPIIMMKAERMSSAKEIIKQIGKCLVEPKFDGFRCISGYTPIYTKDKGYISVRDVQEKDLVLTDKGRFMKVIAINKRIIDKKERVFRLQPYLGDSIKISEGHKILTYTNDQVLWKSIEEIKAGDNLVFPIPKLNQYSSINLPLTKLNLTDESGYKKEINLNTDFFRFLGFWIGDGFTNDFHNTERVGIIFNEKKEKELADEYKKIILNLFKIKKITEYKQNGSLILYWRDKPLRLWLSNYFRREWKGKMLPQWFAYVSKQNFRSFIQGWIESDGSPTSGGGFKIITKERDLAAFAQLIGLQNGMVIGLHKIRNKITKTGFIGTYYQLIIPGTNRYARVTKINIIIRVLSNNLIKRDPRMTLYNLQVDKDETYCSSLVTLHNCQIHKSKDKVQIFSRGLENVTFMYPDIVEGVKKEVKADELIIEGEAIGYNPKTGEFLPFQETVQRKRKYDIGAKAIEVPLKLFAFELLYLNGKNFIKKPFIERRKALENVTIKNKNINKQIIVVDHQEEVDREERLEKIFDQAVEKKLEGVIAKKIDGIYQPGARGWNWIKYKRSYSSKINDTIDCLVMGYDFGKGKRAGFGMGAFLVGIRDEKNDRFMTVAKIGTGLTDEEWRELKIKSLELRIKTKPTNYLVDKMAECDVWLEPQIVVEIKADEITKSPTHTAGLALRFPRLERFRNDKKPEDVTTLEELKRVSPYKD